MTTIRRGIVLAVLGALATAAGARADSPGELAERLRGAKADSRDVLLNGRYAVPASARPFVNVLTTYSPPPKKR
jgi:hypothetical protein